MGDGSRLPFGAPSQRHLHGDPRAPRITRPQALARDTEGTSGGEARRATRTARLQGADDPSTKWTIPPDGAWGAPGATAQCHRTGWRGKAEGTQSSAEGTDGGMHPQRADQRSVVPDGPQQGTRGRRQRVPCCGPSGMAVEGGCALGKAVACKAAPTAPRARPNAQVPLITLRRTEHLASGESVVVQDDLVVTPIAAHVHEFYEIALVCSGRGWHQYGTRWESLRAGDVLLIHPCVPHAYWVSGTGRMVVRNVLFTEAAIGDSADEAQLRSLFIQRSRGRRVPAILPEPWGPSWGPGRLRVFRPATRNAPAAVPRPPVSAPGGTAHADGNRPMPTDSRAPPVDAPRGEERVRRR